ncbi:SirB2 family protein [Thiothrix lacustris]|uniref:SirB2 family protein n=1 Tax=Thiothrix lacustris TaxID=525917 RepID=A0ABY9MKQ9_9GAMM|nr:SirB2 family protein [Thiothrix lacustris]WML89142.1 SirB2 family protein [Thiothrix lacustris]
MDTNMPIVKVHAIVALLSVVVYLIRGFWMLTNNPAVTGKAALASASLSMLLLLVTGLWLALISTTHGVDSFVIIKAVGLIVYVVLGVIALKPGLSKATATILWLAGLATFIYTFLYAKGIAPAVL